MSRVLVIPDVHLKPWIFDGADRVDENSYDDIVILGDLVDDWGKGNDLDAYKETLDLFSTYSNGDPYGNQKLYIVDTETRKYIEAL